MKCPSCGARFQEEQMYCPKCGNLMPNRNRSTMDKKKIMMVVAVIVFLAVLAAGMMLYRPYHTMVVYRQQAMDLMQQGDYEEARRYLWPEMEKNRPDELSMHMYHIATAGTEMKYYRQKACNTLSTEYAYVESMKDGDTKAALAQVIDQIFQPYIQPTFNAIRNREFDQATHYCMELPKSYHGMNDLYNFCLAVTFTWDGMTEEEKLNEIIEDRILLHKIDLDNPYFPEDVRAIMKEEAQRVEECWANYMAHADEICAQAEEERIEKSADLTIAWMKNWQKTHARQDSYGNSNTSSGYSGGSNSGNGSGEKAHGFAGSTDEWEDYDDYMDDYEYWDARDFDDEDDWEDDWDEDW